MELILEYVGERMLSSGHSSPHGEEEISLRKHTELLPLMDAELLMREEELYATPPESFLPKERDTPDSEFLEGRRTCVRRKVK